MTDTEMIDHGLHEQNGAWGMKQHWSTNEEATAETPLSAVAFFVGLYGNYRRAITTFTCDISARKSCISVSFFHF